MDNTTETAACFIVIRGTLDQSWADYLGNFTISSRRAEGRGAMTVLAGPVMDFAAFVGLINLLQNLGLPIQTVSFRHLPHRHPA